MPSQGTLSDVFWIFMVAMASIIAIPIGMGFAIAAIYCSRWELYLTRDTIHYRYHLCSCCWGSKYDIPLSYIKDITIAHNDKSIWLLME